MQLCSSVGISIPKNMLSRIDQERGDVSRSRYVLRILEKVYLSTDQRSEIKQPKQVEADLLDEVFADETPSKFREQ
jgi:hypothetical protein